MITALPQIYLQLEKINSESTNKGGLYEQCKNKSKEQYQNKVLRFTKIVDYTFIIPYLLNAKLPISNLILPIIHYIRGLNQNQKIH